VGHELSDRTVGNILRRHGISPAPQSKQTTRWRDFIRAHMDVLVGTDFFIVDVLTLKGLATISHAESQKRGERQKRLLLDMQSSHK
jgi:putative transposase